MKRLLAHTTALLILAVLFMLGMGSVSAFAGSGDVVIDFEAATPGIFSSMSENEYDIVYVGYGNLPMINVDGSGNHYLRDSYFDMYGAGVVITPKSGSPFMFRSLDYNNLANQAGLFRMDVTVIYASDNSWHTRTFYPASSAYVTLTSSELGISDVAIKELRVNLVSLSANYTVDNIVLSDVTAPIFTEINGQTYDGTDPVDLGYITTGFDKSVLYKAIDEGSGFAGGSELSGSFDIPTTSPGLEPLSETLTIQDLAGNSASVTFQYKVISLDDMVNLLAPMQNRDVFNRNSTIPVKLQLMADSDKDGVPEPQQMSADDLTFALQLWQGEEQITATRTNHLEGLDAAEFTLEAPDFDTYQFNLNTKGLSLGDYELKIYIMDKAGMDEGLIGTVDFTLK